MLICLSSLKSPTWRCLHCSLVCANSNNININNNNNYNNNQINDLHLFSANINLASSVLNSLVGAVFVPLAMLI